MLEFIKNRIIEQEHDLTCSELYPRDEADLFIRVISEIGYLSHCMDDLHKPPDGDYNMNEITIGKVRIIDCISWLIRLHHKLDEIYRAEEVLEVEGIMEYIGINKNKK